MTVYVITKGTYSDYHICAVATDKQHAEKLAKIYTDIYDDAKVEEYDTDAPADLLAGRVPYEVVFRGDGSVYRSTSRAECDWVFRPRIEELDPKMLFSSPGSLLVCLYAPDEEAAVKVAAEKRAEYLAQKEAIS